MKRCVAVFLWSMLTLGTAQAEEANLFQEERKPAAVITIQTMLVECSLDTARELFRDNLGAAKQYTISPSTLQKKRESEPAAKLVVTAVPQLATVSGAQAHARAVVELTYVTDYHTGESGQTPILRTREMGTLLNVTPTLDNDGQTINLTVIPGGLEIMRKMLD